MTTSRARPRRPSRSRCASIPIDLAAAGTGVWLGYAGRTVTQKIAGLVLPIAAFVAVGLEPSVANMTCCLTATWCSLRRSRRGAAFDRRHVRQYRSHDPWQYGRGRSRCAGLLVRVR
ncbi:formate/nitrite transporter family protein [Xanthobacter autotrophicus DSM 597]|uniref:formate/nitrite transporter family protein n=1 Tax=Xanthobacter wiegelii TaxID=3119913 RepID=UPI003727B3DA